MIRRSIKHLKREKSPAHVSEDARHEYFVIKGCLRTYYVDAKEVERNTYFAVEGFRVSDIYGSTFRMPALCNVVAVEDCELV